MTNWRDHAAWMGTLMIILVIIIVGHFVGVPHDPINWISMQVAKAR